MTRERTGQGNGGRATGDVTGSKPAERDLRGLEEQWRSLVENIPDIIITVDADGTILFINHTLSGLAVEGVVGASVYDYVPREHHGTLRKRLGEVFDRGQAHSFEIGGSGPFGRASWYFSRIGPIVRDGRVVAAALITTDITQRRQAEEALRESEERFRDIAENLNDAIFEFDTTGRMTYVSPGMEKVSGRSVSEMIGRSIIELVHPDDLPSVVERVRKRPFGNREPSEYRLLRKSGEARWVHSLGRPVYEGGRVVAFRAVLTDITERKQAEEALQESEEKYRDLVETVNETIYEVDASGRITYISPVAEEAGDYRRSEMIGRSLADLIHPDDLAGAMESVERSLRGEIGAVEFRILTKSGEPRWHRSVARPVMKDGRAAGLRGVLTDLTEGKRAEEALRESEARYRDLVENINDVIYEVDATGRMTYISPVVEETLGYSQSELTGRNFAEFIHPEDFAHAVDSFARNSYGNPDPIEVRVVAKSGEVHWVRSFGRPILKGDRAVGVRGVLTFITKRKRAEEALRESEEQFRLVTEAVPVLISYVDSQQRYRFNNKGYEEWFGRPRAEVQGQLVRDVVGDSAYETIREHIESALSGQEVTFESSVPYRDGGARHVSAVYVPDVSEEGKVRGFVALVTDITERRRAEEALRAVKQRLQHLVSTSPAVIYSAAPEGDYAATFISENVSSQLGYEAREFTQDRKFWADHIHPEDAPHVFAELPRVLVKGHHLQEYRFLHKDGTYRWMRDECRLMRDADGNPSEIVGYWADITERKRAEEALREREETMQALLNAPTESAFLADLDGTILALNDIAARRLGKSVDDLVGSSASDLFPPDVVASRMARIEEVVRSGEPCRFEDTREDKSFDVTIYPIFDADGKVVRVAVFASDITEHKEMEEALQKTREELESKVERQMQRGDLYGLTFRELTVLHLVVAGGSDKEIGTTLGISAQTASKHVANILRRMRASSRTEAGVRALKEGLLD